MKLLFLHGPPAAGKYTIARPVADATGLPLFHNHLIVDAVHAVFPFGSPGFVALRERFWIDVIRAAVAENRSLIFTFQPESSVSPGFPEQVAGIVAAGSGETIFVQLRLDLAGQISRIPMTIVPVSASCAIPPCSNNSTPISPPAKPPCRHRR